MNRVVIILILLALTVACESSGEGAPAATADVVADRKAEMDDSVATDVDAVAEAGDGQDSSIPESWLSGSRIQARIDGFMTTGFMQDPRPVGFSDLAYSDVFLDFEIDNQGRISQISGKLSELYDSYSFVIPVVERRVDAVSGSRQVNREDSIVRLDDTSWQIQPVAQWGAPGFIIRMDRSIEIVEGDTIIRIVKDGSDFTCAELVRKKDGKEELKLSWQITQYEHGPVRDIKYTNDTGLVVPLVMAWDSTSMAGYLASLPEGQPEFSQRLRWVPTGELETDRYNFLVLLTQAHGGQLVVPDRLGSIDPVWLSLLMYDHVVLP